MVRPVLTQRIAALYFGGHALVDLAWWLGVKNVAQFRGWFELDPGRPEVLDAFLMPDLVILGALSAIAAVALARNWRVAAILAGVVTGGSAYATLYLAGWVTLGGHGWMGVAAMSVETAVMAVFVVVVTGRGRVAVDTV